MARFHLGCFHYAGTVFVLDNIRRTTTTTISSVILIVVQITEHQDIDHQHASSPQTQAYSSVIPRLSECGEALSEACVRPSVCPMLPIWLLQNINDKPRAESRTYYHRKQPKCHSGQKTQAYVVNIYILNAVKAKFHYTSWFEAGSKLVADRFEDGRRPASNQIA